MSSPQSRDWVQLLSVRNELLKVHQVLGGWRHAHLIQQVLQAIGNHRRVYLDLTEAISEPVDPLVTNDDRYVCGILHALFATLNLIRANDAYHDHHAFAAAELQPASCAAELKADFEKHLQLAIESVESANQALDSR